MFQQFLLEKYDTLKSLNEAWGCMLENISQAKAVMTPILSNFFSSPAVSGFFVNSGIGSPIKKHNG